MTSKNSSDHKKLKTQELSVSRDEEVSADLLNDDILIYIFEFLTIKEKLKIEMICRRWNYVVKKSWSGIKSMIINNEFFVQHLGSFNEDRIKNTKFIVNILSRCGKYLNGLSIYEFSFKQENILYSKLLKDLPKFCCNLTNLCLYEYDKEHPAITDEILKSVFTKNFRLQNISLKNLRLEGSCLQKLNIETIEKLHIDECEFKSKGYYYGFLSRLKNLKIFSLNLQRKDRKMTIETMMALSISKCESISELAILDEYDLKEVISINLDPEFFLKQKKLSKLSMIKTIVDKEFFYNLPTEHLTILKIFYNENISYSLHRFQNLQCFECVIKIFTDQCVKGLAKCSNLEEIKIFVKNDYLLTEEGERCFSSFKNMKRFSFEVNFQAANLRNLDNLLTAVGECKNLTSISLPFCHSISATGMTSISLLPKLKSVDLHHANIDEEFLAILIRNSISLEELDVFNFGEVTNKTVEIASQIKIERKDSHVLEICYTWTNIQPQDLKNISPLILLTE